MVLEVKTVSYGRLGDTEKEKPGRLTQGSLKNKNIEVGTRKQKEEENDIGQNMTQA